MIMFCATRLLNISYCLSRWVLWSHHPWKLDESLGQGLPYHHGHHRKDDHHIVKLIIITISFCREKKWEAKAITCCLRKFHYIIKEENQVKFITGMLQTIFSIPYILLSKKLIRAINILKVLAWLCCHCWRWWNVVVWATKPSVLDGYFYHHPELQKVGRKAPSIALKSWSNFSLPCLAKGKKNIKQRCVDKSM